MLVDNFVRQVSTLPLLHSISLILHSLSFLHSVNFRELPFTECSFLNKGQQIVTCTEIVTCYKEIVNAGLGFLFDIFPLAQMS
jgi:hypothetical protein